MKTAEDIQLAVRRHNSLQLLIGVGSFVLAVGLWVLSFWIWRLLFYIPLALLGFDGMWERSWYVAWGLIVLLAIEGVRYGRPLFDLIEYHRSWYYDNALLGGGPYTLSRGNFLGIPYLVSQTLFCAPRTTVIAIKSLLATIRLPIGLADSAARIYNELAADRRWRPRADFPDDEDAIHLLAALRLIWTDDEREESLIRIPAGRGSD